MTTSTNGQKSTKLLSYWIDYGRRRTFDFAHSLLFLLALLSTHCLLSLLAYYSLLDSLGSWVFLPAPLDAHRTPRLKLGSKAQNHGTPPNTSRARNPIKHGTFAISNRREVLAKNASGSDMKNLTITSRGVSPALKRKDLGPEATATGVARCEETEECALKRWGLAFNPPRSMCAVALPKRPECPSGNAAG